MSFLTVARRAGNKVVIQSGASTENDLTIDSSGNAQVILAAGTAAIGKLAANSGVDIGDVDVTSIAAGENHVGEVGGKGLQITVTPTLTVGATYVSGDFVGTSATGMEVAGAARISGGTGRVVGAILHDYVVASVAAELWLFTVTPAGLPADSAAFTITDNLTCIGVIPFNTYYASALNSISNGIIPNGQLPYKCVATSLYGALVTRGAPAYTNGLVSVSIFVDQD